MEEKDIFSKKLVIEQKIFYFDLKTTPKGEYLKVTEKRNGMRNTIKIPANGLKDFKNIMESIIDFANNYSMNKYSKKWGNNYEEETSE